jgi:putative heme iron utilization protein
VRHTPFSEDEEAAIVAHLSSDHAAELLTIARAFGPGPHVTDAAVAAIDTDGMDLWVTVDGQQRPAQVPFATRLHDRADVTEQFAVLTRAARHTLGLPPAPDPT